MSDDQSRALRRGLREKLEATGQLHSPRIGEAFEAIPRELFVPEVDVADAYRSSEAIVVKRLDGVGVSSASAPDVVALMLEQLDPRPGQRILEIGAGTGYNAALLGYIVGPTGRVVTLDIDDDLVDAAREHLARAGATNVQAVVGDGALGYPDEEARFDRIMLTVASRDIAPAWRDQLARPDGRLVLPLSVRGVQRCIGFGCGALATASGSTDDLVLVGNAPRACYFISMRGVLASPTVQVPLGATGGLNISVPDNATGLPDVARLASLIEHRAGVWPTGVLATRDDVRDGLHLWLVAHDPHIYTLWADPDVRQVPDLLGMPDRFRSTLCAWEPSGAGVGLLAWSTPPRRLGEAELSVQATERDAAARLVEQVRAWDAAGRPADQALCIRAFRRGKAQPSTGTLVQERWTTFALEWAPPTRRRS